MDMTPLYIAASIGFLFGAAMAYSSGYSKAISDLKGKKAKPRTKWNFELLYPKVRIPEKGENLKVCGVAFDTVIWHTRYQKARSLVVTVLGFGFYFRIDAEDINQK